MSSGPGFQVKSLVDASQRRRSENEDYRVEEEYLEVVGLRVRSVKRARGTISRGIQQGVDLLHQGLLKALFSRVVGGQLPGLSSRGCFFGFFKEVHVEVRAVLEALRLSGCIPGPVVVVLALGGCSASFQVARLTKVSEYSLFLRRPQSSRRRSVFPSWKRIPSRRRQGMPSVRRPTPSRACCVCGHVHSVDVPKVGLLHLQGLFICVYTHRACSSSAGRWVYHVYFSKVLWPSRNIPAPSGCRRLPHLGAELGVDQAHW